MNRKLLIITILIVICLLSCTKNKRRDDAIKIVREWTGREIRFPENVPCYVLGKDTLYELCEDCFHKEYKILLYVDSTGCNDCRLQLSEWKQLKEEIDSLFPGKVGFLLYFQPKNLRYMGYLYMRDQFDYPIFVDTNDEINRLNQFSQVMEYQCFLLNSDNKVLVIGNPALNMHVWELYKSQIAEEKEYETNIK